MTDFEDKAWEAAVQLLVLDDAPDDSTLRYAVLSFAGKVTPGHLAIRLIEQQRAVLRGERGPLADGELALLQRQAKRLGLVPAIPI